jgi:hypothetical protein|tara:strand:+ start:2679 stop:2939 length:261 start_codon:yes stop_codon:yes gene_type:complete
MDEYVVDVLIDGHKETLKSFGNSIYSIIDSMITLESVEDVFLVTRTNDNQTWDVENIDLVRLRAMRKEIDPNALADSLHSLTEIKH